MTTPSASASDPFVDFGFTPEEAAAFRLLWKSNLLPFFLDEIADAIHDMGGTPEQALDYIKHGVEDRETRLFYFHGFTAHHAWLVCTNPDALHNLHTRLTSTVNAFLADDGPPRDFLVDVLRIADSPKEADLYRMRYMRAVAGRPMDLGHGPDTPEGIIAEVGVLTMHLPSANHCDCS